MFQTRNESRNISETRASSRNSWQTILETPIHTILLSLLIHRDTRIKLVDRRTDSERKINGNETSNESWIDILQKKKEQLFLDVARAVVTEGFPVWWTIPGFASGKRFASRVSQTRVAALYRFERDQLPPTYAPPSFPIFSHYAEPFWSVQR